MKPAIVIYSDRLVPDRFAGCCYGPLIAIRPVYRADRGLHEHEFVHARQWWRGLGLGHALRYRFSRAYRLRCEVEAYREQMRWYAVDRLPLFARFLADKYDLRITFDEAAKLLGAP
jgi:hypothetical protein